MKFLLIRIQYLQSVFPRPLKYTKTGLKKNNNINHDLDMKKEKTYCEHALNLYRQTVVVDVMNVKLMNQF